MAERKEIHDFAVKYRSLYMNPQTTDREVMEGFADQCFSLGFRMDCGNRFIKKFSSDAFYKSDALNKIIDDVNDVEILGSAIFSRWRYVTHCGFCSSLLDENYCLWFITAFGRLAVITEESETCALIFEGTLQMIQLVSDNICYGPCPKPEDEVEQHLTIMADGRVWLSRYRFGSIGSEHDLIEKLTFSVSAEAANAIMTAVSGYFSAEHNIEFLTDVGSWELTLTNNEGQIYKRTGPLDNDLQIASGGLSDLIRSKLERDDLFVFDGNPDAK